MNQLTLLILQLLVFLEEAEELVVERRATHHLLGIIKLHRDASALQNEWQHGFIIHEDVGHLGRIHTSLEVELPMDYIT